MHRFLFAVLLAAGSTPALAQQSIYVAPSRNTVTGSSEQSAGSDQAHVLYVQNRSSVPIIVFGIVISACENVRQWCAGRSTNFRIEPGNRQIVGRVDPKSLNQPFSYRWDFSYRADSADARFIAALRENGLAVEDTSDRRAEALRALARSRGQRPVVIDTSSPPGIEQPLSREPMTAAERGVGLRFRPPGEEDAPSAPVAFRFKVAYGSILGSTMMKAGSPVQLLGPCIDPAESARLERDGRITRTPWRPPVLDEGVAHTSLPAALRDSTVRGEVLVRWVADTTGETIPGSVRVLESPHPLVSVKVCTAVIGSRATPARDRAGRPIRAWVQMPVRIGR